MREEPRDFQEKKEDGMQEKAGMRERLCRALDLMPDAFFHESCVEIRGRGSVTVSGARKIVTYTPERIRLALWRGALLVEGKRLLCTSYFSGTVGIDGQIDRVSFEEEA